MGQRREPDPWDPAEHMPRGSRFWPHLVAFEVHGLGPGTAARLWENCFVSLWSGAQSRVPHTARGFPGLTAGSSHRQRVPWAGLWALSKHPIVLAQEDMPWDSSSSGSQLSPHSARF